MLREVDSWNPRALHEGGASLGPVSNKYTHDESTSCYQELLL